MTGQLSAAEERFERIRQQVGLLLAPGVGLVLWFTPIAGLNEAAHRLLAVLGLTVTLWVTEALPLPATALLGPTLCVLTGITPAKEVFRSFADPIIFLFLGSFLLAEGMLHHGLNRRIAYKILGWPMVSRTPARLLAAFAGLTGFISMWVSNTATTAMMFPIGMALLTGMSSQRKDAAEHRAFVMRHPYATGLMLATAFAASIGGLGTPVGTPPNLIGLGLIEQHLQLRLTFFQWMCFGVPLALALVLMLIGYLNRLCPGDQSLLGGSTDWLQAEKARLGPLRRAEKNVLAAFGLTVGIWLIPGFCGLLLGNQSPVVGWLNHHLPEAVAALLGGLLLFILPVNFSKREFTLGWTEAQRIDWGTILLFGGGLALGDLMFSTGLARWMGEGLAGTLHLRSALGLVALFTATAIVLSEATSNTASATMIVPVAIAVAQAAGVDPLGPAMGACLGASMGFMLPVSTPPNAIVYSSGCVPLIKMMKYGLLLDLLGFAVIVPVATWLVPWLIRG
jgi:sodium-dependent dicarboxylate transporter 2/3/5